MRESTEISCNCYGPILSNDKFFLSRNSTISQPNSSPSHRSHKSTELQALEKATKKSLKKKRPNSFHQAPSHQHPPYQPWKQEQDLNYITLKEVQSKPVNYMHRTAEAPLASRTPANRNNFSFRYPQTSTNRGHHPHNIFSEEIKKQQAHSIEQFRTQGNMPARIVFQHPVSTLPPNHDPRNHQSVFLANPKPEQEGHSPNRSPKLKQPKVKRKSTVQEPLPHVPYEPFLHEEISSPGYYSQQSCRNDKMLTQSWAHNEADLIIQGFDRLFKNKEQNMSQSELPSSKRMNPRQIQRSKRLEKQQLMGRFAQSGGQESQEQTPSEVIGRGFDRTYQQDLLHEEEVDHQKGGVAYETKASRSTNTRVSEMANLRRISGQVRDPFAQPKGYQNYKFL